MLVPASATGLACRVVVVSWCTPQTGVAGSWTACPLLQEDFAQAMRGIVCDTDARVRDEAPHAYKDLAKVMANQASLTDIVHRHASRLLCKVGSGTSALHAEREGRAAKQCTAMEQVQSNRQQQNSEACCCALVMAVEPCGWKALCTVQAETACECQGILRLQQVGIVGTSVGACIMRTCCCY